MFHAIFLFRYSLNIFFDFNFYLQSGWTALHNAAMNGFTRVVKLLLHNGANPYVMDNVSGCFDINGESILFESLPLFEYFISLI